MSNTITQKQLNQIIGYGSIAVAAAILYGACCMVEDIIQLGAQFRAYCDRLVEVSMGTQYRSNAIAGFVPAGLLPASADTQLVSEMPSGECRVLIVQPTEFVSAAQFEHEGYTIYSVSASKDTIVWCGAGWGWQTLHKVGAGIIKHYKTLSAAKTQLKKLPESAYKSQAYVLREFY